MNKSIRKFTATVLAVVIAMSMLCLFASAVDKVNALVTVADGNGKIVLGYAAVSVTDADKDGKITANDALYCAHVKYYDGGAAGYETSKSQYGLGMDRLWGDDTNGLQAFGYYLNDEMLSNLEAVITDGDYVAAFVYTDKVSWSDKYAFFDIKTVSAVRGDKVTLSLSIIDYDANWNAVAKPFSGATITVDGESTKVVTDANGKATVTLDKAGNHVIGATSTTKTGVAAVCIASVKYSSNSLINLFLTIIEKISAFFGSLFSR